MIAIAVQDEREAKLSAEKSGAHFPILADDNGAIAEAYGVEDNGWSTPSVFVIGQDGSILWQEITNMESYQGCGIDRVSSQTILENLSLQQSKIWIKLAVVGLLKGFCLGELRSPQVMG